MTIPGCSPTASSETPSQYQAYDQSARSSAAHSNSLAASS